MITTRPELEALPSRLKTLRVDARGYPVPWFVAWIDGEPEFRAMDPGKWLRAVKERRCWVCGQTLGKWLAFVIGPMCGINRTTSEPPCHLECAQWSARNCPFLSRPHMHRRDGGIVEELRNNNAGIPITRNPGVTLIWITRAYQVYDDGSGKPLIEIGPADRVEWWAEGRRATRDEVEHSITTGLPLLEAMCEKEPTPARCLGARAELTRRAVALASLYP